MLFTGILHFALLLTLLSSSSLILLFFFSFQTAAFLHFIESLQSCTKQNYTRPRLGQTRIRIDKRFVEQSDHLYTMRSSPFYVAAAKIVVTLLFVSVQYALVAQGRFRHRHALYSERRIVLILSLQSSWPLFFPSHEQYLLRPDRNRCHRRSVFNVVLLGRCARQTRWIHLCRAMPQCSLYVRVQISVQSRDRRVSVLRSGKEQRRKGVKTESDGHIPIHSRALTYEAFDVCIFVSASHSKTMRC